MVRINGLPSKVSGSKHAIIVIIICKHVKDGTLTHQYLEEFLFLSQS